MSDAGVVNRIRSDLKRWVADLICTALGIDCFDPHWWSRKAAMRSGLRRRLTMCILLIAAFFVAILATDPFAPDYSMVFELGASFSSHAASEFANPVAVVAVLSAPKIVIGQLLKLVVCVGPRVAVPRGRGVPPRRLEALSPEGSKIALCKVAPEARFAIEMYHVHLWLCLRNSGARLAVRHLRCVSPGSFLVRLKNVRWIANSPKLEKN